MPFNKTTTYKFICLFIISISIASCNYTKHLTENQTLLKENKVILKTAKPIKNKGELESSILTLTSPQPNTHLLDLDFLPNYKLWKYNNRYALYKRDTLNSKLQKRKVEKPVLVDSFEIERSKQMITQFMINQGYFYNTVLDTIIPSQKPKTSTVQYTINAGKNYYIKDITYECENNSILSIIINNIPKSFLVKGEEFNHFKCGNERERLYKLIRSAGYYDFKTDNISFIIDTIDRSKIKRLLDDPFSQISTYDNNNKTTNDSINVMLRVLKSKDSTYNQLYTINKIQVEIIDYNSQYDTRTSYTENTLDNVDFKYKSLPINRNVIVRNILMQVGDIYNNKDLEATVNRLNQLGVFQFVNFRFDKDSLLPGKLNCYLVLNTSPKMDIVGMTDISTSDGDYLLGLGAGITYKNKNLFHGANQLLIRGAYSTEFRNDNLLTGTKKFYQSGNNANFTTNLSFPKFIVPFNQRIFNKRNLPFTILGLNYSFIQRIQNYTVVNVSGSFGYTWKETSQKSWRLNPSFLTLTRLPERYLGEAFKKKLSENKYLENIFSNNIIYGENMTFEYISKFKNEYQDFSSLKIGVEEAGTLLQGVNYIYNKISNNNLKPIAQYLKLDGDFRNYKNWKKMQWVNRVMLGLGIPTGKDLTLPYIKQYSAGGAFSNRGWRARRVGPGRSLDSSYSAGSTVIDRTGDIKFEANSEFRFNLLKLFSGAINLKGATFVDAGNIWLFHKSPNVIGGEINKNYLWQDIAISAGAGLRLDFSFFVFRIDLAYPIKQPQITTNSGWAFDQLKYKSGIYNLAIGYPF